jgi:uncharacterized surface protein with fasciclin (FAS1) repeats
LYFYNVCNYKIIMTSNGPFSQTYSLGHMDRRVGFNTNPNKFSITGIINNSTRFTKFKHILQTSAMSGLFDHEQTDATIFVPSDEYLENVDVSNINISSARHIVRSSTLNRKIPSDVLKHSPFSYYQTKHPQNRMCVRNNGEFTILNGYIKVLDFDIIADNGLIHVIDNLVDPIEI